MTENTDRTGRRTDQIGRAGRTVVAVSRPLDPRIPDRAAALFARRGVEATSVQAVADAVGLSKAGLLHHVGSKDGLLALVLQEARALGDRALAAVEHLPLGPVRDRRALEVLVDEAMAHPGLVSLLLVPATSAEGDGVPAALDAGGASALLALGVEDPDTEDPERLVRVGGALVAVAVLSLNAAATGRTTLWRSLVVATAYDALGHPAAAPAPRKA